MIVGAFGSYFWAQTPSTGKWILTPFSLALSMIFWRVLGSSGISIRVQPSLCPSNCFKKGLLIPPPIMISSATLSILRISSILSVTFDPPRMTSTGFLGLYRNPPKNSSSFCMRSPATLNLWLTPTTEEWARWADPNASLTKTFPNRESSPRKDAIFSCEILIFFPSLSLMDPSSSGWNLTF